MSGPASRNGNSLQQPRGSEATLSAGTSEHGASSGPAAIKNEDYTAAAGTVSERDGDAAKNTSQIGSLRFWLAYSGLCIMAIAASLDILMIITALPTIIRELNGNQQDYIWLANSYMLASTAVQPLFGQLANLFGRRRLVIGATILFLVGSGVAGGATSIRQAIAGRTIQGLGSGGIIMLLDLITCDLVPLRLRPKYLGAVLAACALGNAIGPLIGGAITTEASWRWIFYINLPIGGFGLVFIVFFLNVNVPTLPPIGEIFARVDFLGNTLFIASIISLQIGLLFGGVLFPWGSYQTIVPIILGAVGWICFHFYQASSLCQYPTMPPRFFQNRTSVIGFWLVFTSSLLMSWSSYFLPLYFQIIRNASPLGSGVDILPLVLVLVPAAGIAGGLVTKTGRYRTVHAVGFALMMLGFGLFSLFDLDTKAVQWAFSQIIVAAGLGFPLTTTLPPIQAALPESDAAGSTATYAFIRSFGFVWSVTIPSIIMTNHMSALLGGIKVAAVQDILRNGGAILQVDQTFFAELDPAVREQVLAAYVDSFKAVWYVAIGVSAAGFLSVFGEKHLKLRTELETDYGLKE